jgi:nitroreductase
MNKFFILFTGLVFLVLSCTIPGNAADSTKLPNPQLEGKKTLVQALQERKSARAFSDEKLSPQTLSNLLWAAFGISRPDGRRTAPSARNWQEIDIYVSTPEGLYLWDAKSNELTQILAKDIRALTGTQPYVKEAAVNLIYVADFSKVSGGGGDQNTEVGADTGFISQNVYLYCASEGLATVVRALIDRDALSKEMKLKPEQKIILAQSVGYPKK